MERSRLAWAAVLRHPGVVRHIARRVYGFVDDDTVSASQISLHDALLYTDPSKGSPFRVGVWFALRDLCGRHGVHVPRSLVIAYRAWVGQGNDPRMLETKTHLSDEERVRIVWLLSRSISEIDLHGMDNHMLGERPDRTDMDLEMDLAQIRELLGGMSDRNRESLLCPFDDEETLRAVGERHGLSSERIRQIHAQLLRKLQKLFLKDDPHG